MYLLMGLAVHGNRIRALEDEMGAVLGSHFGPASHAPDFECKEQVESFLQGQREFGLIVSDEEKDVEQQLVEDLRRYKEAGTPFVREPLDLRRIVDNVRGG